MQPRNVTLSVVVPVYRGEATIEAVVDEVAGTADALRDAGVVLEEVVLVNDGAVDGSPLVLERLESESPLVRAVWLSRNFGQHAATLAGISSTTCDWIVTMDEDGLHDPAHIPTLLQAAEDSGADLVYGMPRGEAPHPGWRNATSRMAKRLASRLVQDQDMTFSSFRLVEGSVARALAAYCGYGVYLDVALRWVVGDVAYRDVPYRAELREQSGYQLRDLLTHLRRLVLTSGTRPLRLVSTVGLLATFVGLGVGVLAVLLRIFGDVDTQGWASLMAVISTFGGLILLSLGAIAEYLGAAVDMATGRPPYLIIGRPPRSRRTGAERSPADGG